MIVIVLRRLQAASAASIGQDPRWFEMASAAAAFGFGITVLAGPAGFAHPGYAELGLVVPPAWLGTIMLLAGMAQAVAVLLDHQTARIPFACLLGSAWLLVAVYVGGAAPWSPTVSVMLVLSLGDTAAMLMLIHLHRAGRVR